MARRYGGWKDGIGPLVVTSPMCMGSSSKRNRKKYPTKVGKHRDKVRAKGGGNRTYHYK